MSSNLLFSVGSEGPAALNVGRRGWLPDVAARGLAVPGSISVPDAAGWEGVERRMGAEAERGPAIAIDSNGDETRVTLFRRLGAGPAGMPLPLFVYGTLMRGESNYDVMKPFRCERVANARVRGLMVDLGSYPGLIRPLNIRSHVAGELMWLPEIGEALEATDRLEEFAGFGEARSMYRRTILNVHREDGVSEAAWAYVYNRPVGQHRLISGGDWKAYRVER
jgi:gamma-glutamylcyclotransferase (GGCT)/AIG2-like uncharacterized protein YtfP